MIRDFTMRYAPAALVIVAAFIILLLFGHNLYSSSQDLDQHNLLASVIYTMGIGNVTVTPALDAMAYYPDYSHWLVAMISPIVGGTIYALSYISIFCIIIQTVFLLCVLSRFSGVSLSLPYAGILILLHFLDTGIGSEIFGNFFFPQLVAATIYIIFVCTYCLMYKNGLVVVLLPSALLLGLLLQVQPIVCLHVIAFGSIFSLLTILIQLREAERHAAAKSLLLLIAYLLISFLLVIESPSFKFMRIIADHDGALGFFVAPVILFSCFGIISIAASAIVFFSPKRLQMDIILMAAALSSIGVTTAQYLVFVLLHVGSHYAVDKHMFLCATFSSVILIRAASIVLPTPLVYIWRRIGVFLIGPIAFCVCCVTLWGAPFDAGVAQKMSQSALDLISIKSSRFTPGNTLAAVEGVPWVFNALVSSSIFHASRQDVVKSYSGTFSPEFAMVRKTDRVRSACAPNDDGKGAFIIVPKQCLDTLVEGQPLTFTPPVDSGHIWGEGWHEVENGGVWSTGGTSTLRFRVLRKHPGDSTSLDLALSLEASPTQKDTSLPIKTSVDGKYVQTVSLPKGAVAKRYLIPLGSDAANGEFVVDLSMGTARSPYDIGLSGDTRPLGFRLTAIEVVEQPDLERHDGR